MIKKLRCLRAIKGDVGYLVMKWTNIISTFLEEDAGSMLRADSRKMGTAGFKLFLGLKNATRNLTNSSPVVEIWDGSGSKMEVETSGPRQNLSHLLFS